MNIDESALARMLTSTEKISLVREILATINEQDTIDAIRKMVNARQWDDEGASVEANKRGTKFVHGQSVWFLLGTGMTAAGVISTINVSDFGIAVHYDIKVTSPEGHAGSSLVRSEDHIFSSESELLARFGLGNASPPSSQNPTP